ncbi:MAG TPA: DnaA/Hda family protein [Micropepsaceae bacterium]|nr:DnaA/Hda family protein [Micropepsaceae bacterium]HRK70891.1 DnaA/Hda family protein [Micropepsaceae bacterium]
MAQIALPFGLAARPAMGRSDFFASHSNALALALIDQWPQWTPPVCVIAGPQGSGKSHLVHVWQSRSGAEVLAADDLARINLDRLGAAPLAIEDLDAALRDGLEPSVVFHLHNRIIASGQTLLVTARMAPQRWQITLPDLATRMRGALFAEIAPPDDALLAAVLLKHFADRQVRIAENLVPWLIKRLERSLAAAASTAAILDEAALAAKKPITIALAREILGG